MTASALTYRTQPTRRPRSTARVARAAAQTRRKRTVSLRYRSIVQVVGSLAVATVLIVAYLWLMANVTRMNYEYAKATRERTQVLDNTARLEDEIAHLESRERLAIIAAKLGMTEPARFSVATLAPLPLRGTAQPEQPTSGVALLPAITDWLR